MEQLNKDGNSLIPQFPHIDKSEDLNTPTFSDYIFDNIPEPLKEICSAFKEKRERDIILLGSLTTISSFIHNIYGRYKGDKVYSNLYLFVVAPPSSGKGILKHCRYIAQPVHDQFKNMPEDEKAPKRMFILPGNNSSTGIYQLLSENKGVGLLIETEGDTLSNSFKQDFGDFSSGLRNAFQHEPISYNRRKENERVEISEPRISVLLSGTPMQVRNLIPSSENGLFSRFMFYTFEAIPSFDNVFEKNVESDLKEHFQQIGFELFKYYQDINLPEKEYRLTHIQEKEFIKYFQELTDRLTSIFQADNIIAVVRRLGLIYFRLSMILTYLRSIKSNENTIECSSVDFCIAKEIIEVLIEHSIVVLDYLPKHDIGKMPVKNEQVLLNLPIIFSRQDYLSEASKVGIPDKTIEGFISRKIKSGYIQRTEQGKYQKILS